AGRARARRGPADTLMNRPPTAVATSQVLIIGNPPRTGPRRELSWPPGHSLGGQPDGPAVFDEPGPRPPGNPALPSPSDAAGRRSPAVPPAAGDSPRSSADRAPRSGGPTPCD